MIFLLTVIFGCIALFDIPIMIKNGYWRELSVFSVLLAIAFIMSIFYILEIPIFSTAKAIAFLVKNILHLNYK